MSIRVKRVEGVIQESLGDIFQKILPLGGLTTITDIKVTPDLGIARIYLSILGKDANVTLAFLNENKKRVRKDLAFQMRNVFRRVPELEFYIDDQAETARRIDQLIEEAKR